MKKNGIWEKYIISQISPESIYRCCRIRIVFGKIKKNHFEKIQRLQKLGKKDGKCDFGEKVNFVGKYEFGGKM